MCIMLYYYNYTTIDKVVSLKLTLFHQLYVDKAFYRDLHYKVSLQNYRK